MREFLHGTVLGDFGALLAFFVLAPAIAGTPAPIPASTSKQVPLKEIGHVRATTAFCKSELRHTIVAIDTVLDNDAKLLIVATTMRHVDLDTSELTKFQGSRDLNREYVALKASALSGRSEINALKAEAKNAPSGPQKKALLALGNALDGALTRQQLLADAIGRLVGYIDNHAPIDKEAHDRMELHAIVSQNDRFSAHPPQGPLSVVPDTLTDIAQQGAVELEKRSEPLSSDEDDAAAKIDPAFENC